MSDDKSWSLDGIDADLEDDLRSVGVIVSTTGVANSLDHHTYASLPDEMDARDAMASQMLKLIADDERELDRLSNACDAEIVLITARYKAIAAPTARALAEKIKIVERIALSAGFQDAKKKSRATPYGKYGIRHQPERFEILDPEKALAAAKQFAPAAVSWTDPKPKERVLQGDLEAYFNLIGKALPEKKAELLDEFGCRIVKEYDKPFFELIPSGK